MKQYVLLMENFETLNEFYGVDTLDEQYVIQDFYHRFENMCEDGSSKWTKILFDKKQIIWKNPAN